MAEDAAGIGEPIRMLWRGGIQEDTDRFLRLSAEDHGAGVDFAGLASVAVDIENAASAVAIQVHEDSVDHGVRNERAISASEGVSDGGKGGVEIRMRHAAAFAGAAKVARAAAVDRLGEIGRARGHYCAAELFLDAIAEESFLAGERNGRLKLAVGKMFETFGAAGDAHVFFDEIVVGLDIFVTERPVFSVAIKGSSLEIPITEAQDDAAPHVGAATGHTQAAHPIEWLVSRCRVRLFEVVDEPFVGVFVANSEFDLYGTRFANEFRCLVAIFEFEFGLVLGEILIGLRAACFEECDLQAGFGEALASPATGSTGADHDDVKGMIFLLEHKTKIRSEC